MWTVLPSTVIETLWPESAPVGVVTRSSCAFSVTVVPTSAFVAEGVSVTRVAILRTVREAVADEVPYTASPAAVAFTSKVPCAEPV